MLVASPTLTMGGSNVEAAPTEWVETEKAMAATPTSTTVVLVGKTGNGKSATGNSILGDRPFKSHRSLRSVTATCSHASVVKEDGRRVNVVDTPGLFDSSLPPEQLVSEISRCIELAREGIHAIVLVLSSSNRFSTEEMAAVNTLQTIFGDKVMNYMIIVFTGGDELEADDLTIDDFLHNNGCTVMHLQELLDRCQNRKMVFNNRTKDEKKLMEQTAELLRMVDAVVAANGGEPYSTALFKEAQDLAASQAKQEDLSKRIAEIEKKAAEEKQRFDDWRKESQESHANQVLNLNDSEERLKVSSEEQKRNVESDMTSLREELHQSQQTTRETQERLEHEIANKGCMIL